MSLRFVTHVGLRDGLWRRGVAHSPHLRSVAKLLSLFVKTNGIERSYLLAEDITYVLKFEFDCLPGAITVFLALYVPKYQETAADLSRDLVCSRRVRDEPGRFVFICCVGSANDI